MLTVCMGTLLKCKESKLLIISNKRNVESLFVQMLQLEALTSLISHLLSTMTCVAQKITFTELEEQLELASKEKPFQ
jgi:hypothetical protein